MSKEGLSWTEFRKNRRNYFTSYPVVIIVGHIRNENAGSDNLEGRKNKNWH